MRHHQTQNWCSEVRDGCQRFSLRTTREPRKHNRAPHGRASDTITAGHVTHCWLRQRGPLIRILRSGDRVLFRPNGPEHEAHLSPARRLACRLQSRQQPSGRRWVPRATTRCQNTTLVQSNDDSSVKPWGRRSSTMARRLAADESK
jgi:hypothetical protein